MAQIRLKNRTKSNARVGSYVRIDPANPDSFLYVETKDMDVVGTVAQAVPPGNMCLIDLLETSGASDGLYESVINTATTPYNVVLTDIYIYIDATAGNKIVNLPPATGSGRILTIKKIAGAVGNTVTVTADITGVADMIDGSPTVVMATLYTSLTIQDGVVNNWYIN